MQTMNVTIQKAEKMRHSSALVLVATGALAMSYGWGFRGDYGHEVGAMVPGALLGMAVCLCSGREDWFRRTAVAGWLGAIGWAFGGQMSYGMIPSYTISDSFPDVLYGYTCLFIVGALWGAIGAAFLSFAFTKSREELQTYVGPALAIGILWSFIGILVWIPEHLAVTYEIDALQRIENLGAAGQSVPFWLSAVGSLATCSNALDDFTVGRMHDVDWFGATTALIVAAVYWAASSRSRKACKTIVLLAVGWWIGYLIFVRVLDLHMQPKPGGTQRSDNWAGCIGLLAALLVVHWRDRNRAGLMLTFYGLLAGGIGFSVGDFLNKPDKIRWEPFYQFEFLRGFDHWKWTEQGFGLIMGAIVSIGILRLLRSNISPPEENEPADARIRADEFALFGLLIVVFWWNFCLNPRNLYESGRITDMTLFGLKSPFWLFALACLYVPLVIRLILRHRRDPVAILPATFLGRGQLLFLFFLWVTVAGVVTKAWPLGSRGLLFVHLSFWVTAALCTWLVLTRPSRAIEIVGERRTPEDSTWSIRWYHGPIGVAACILLLVSLVFLTMSMHEGGGNGFRYRFGPEAYHLQEPEQR